MTGFAVVGRSVSWLLPRKDTPRLTRRDWKSSAICTHVSRQSATAKLTGCIGGASRRWRIL
jgi:hypothetical protein